MTPSWHDCHETYEISCVASPSFMNPGASWDKASNGNSRSFGYLTVMPMYDCALACVLLFNYNMLGKKTCL